MRPARAAWRRRAWRPPTPAPCGRPPGPDPTAGARPWPRPGHRPFGWHLSRRRAPGRGWRHGCPSRHRPAAQGQHHGRLSRHRPAGPAQHRGWLSRCRPAATDLCRGCSSRAAACRRPPSDRCPRASPPCSPGQRPYRRAAHPRSRHAGGQPNSGRPTPSPAPSRESTVPPTKGRRPEAARPLRRESRRNPARLCGPGARAWGPAAGGCGGDWPERSSAAGLVPAGLARGRPGRGRLAWFASGRAVGRVAKAAWRTPWDR